MKSTKFPSLLPIPVDVVPLTDEHGHVVTLTPPDQPQPKPKLRELLSVEQLGCPPGLTVHVQGWHSNHPMFKAVIDDVKPTTIIEVGTWLGASTLHMADLTRSRENGLEVLPPATIYCVDTWLGGADHEMNAETTIPRLLGYPQLYYQFLANINASPHAGRVIPVPQTSTTGAIMLEARGIVADLVYVDGSHEMGDVYQDLRSYWRLLRSGGVMFGDDYKSFAGVFVDVNRFANEFRLKIDVVEDIFWCVYKP